jgi:zinc/manganese transport system ATP-binding protein
MRASSPPSIRFENVTLGYGGRPAVHHLQGEIAPGSLTAIVGPNGAGKTTLIKGVLGLIRPLAGRIAVTGVGQARVAYLPQQSAVDHTFPITAEELAAIGLWPRIGWRHGVNREERERVRSAISAVGLEGFERRTLDTLSGGQLQRVLFARVLVQDSPLILLDEPFTAIDSKTASDLMSLIERWHGEGRTVLAVLHDLQLTRERFPRALLLARETVAWGIARDVLTAANLLKARTITGRWDDAAPWCRGASDEPV